MEKKLQDLVDKALSRRSFLAGAGSVAAGTLIAGCDNSTPAATTPPTTTTAPTTTTTPAPAAVGDTDILNFALNLEYLEAEFYLRAATGQGLSSADTGNATSKTTGGAAVPGLSTAQQNYIYEIAMNELDHVRFLRSALGSAAVAAPTIDLTASFNAAASAAGVGSTFNPFSGYQAFLIGAFIFEDVGVTAYHGAAGLFSTTTAGKGYLGAAASILAVEAYHAAEIRTLLIADSVQNATTASGKVTPNNTYITIANQISALRAKLGGNMETPITPLPAYSTPFVPTAYTPASSIVAADPTNSIAFARTTDQVLHIVYATAGAGAGVTGGGFFPNGLNGLISKTAS